jgi:hypothetical protein
MALNTRALALAGALAGTTLFAAPAAAASLPATSLGAPSAAFESSRYDPAATIADWRCRGYGCGYGRRGFGRRGFRRGVGAGDVLIGAAIIGGIAAIVSSNNRRERDRDVVIVERDVRDREYNPRFEERRDTQDNDFRGDRRDDSRSGPRGTGASGLDTAVDQCLARIERDVRVDTVDNVDRTGAGWQVSGTLFNGTPFQCRIGNNGQIDGVDYGGSLSRAPSVPYLGREERLPGGNPPPAESVPYLGKEQAQWNDQRYADARARLGQSAPNATLTDQRLPAYPGGPIPGEEIPETIDGDI